MHGAAGVQIFLAYSGEGGITMPSQASIVAASAWMVGLTLLLFFVPGINGLIGGLVGGYKAGSVGRALGAAVLPAVIVAIALWILLAAFSLPVIGAVAGLAIGVIVLLADVGIFLGAAVGGALARAGASRTAA